MIENLETVRYYLIGIYLNGIYLNGNHYYFYVVLFILL